jgi:hypothetical protein
MPWRDVGGDLGAAEAPTLEIGGELEGGALFRRGFSDQREGASEDAIFILLRVVPAGDGGGRRECR